MSKKNPKIANFANLILSNGNYGVETGWKFKCLCHFSVHCKKPHHSTTLIQKAGLLPPRVTPYKFQPEIKSDKQAGVPLKFHNR